MYLAVESVFVIWILNIRYHPLHLHLIIFKVNFLTLNNLSLERQNMVSLGEHVEGWAQCRQGTTKRKQDNNYSQYTQFPKTSFFKLSLNAIPDARLATVSGTLFQMSTTECRNDDL